MTDDNPLLLPLPADALETIELVHDELRKTGRWPIGDYVARRLGGRFDLDALVRALPMLPMSRYGPILHSGGGFVDRGEPFKVTVAGLSQVPTATATVASVLGLVADLAERYAALPPDPNRPVEMELRWSDLAGLVHARVGGNRKLDVDLALAVFSGEPPGWGSYHLGDKSGEATWRVSGDLALYAGLDSVEEYLGMVVRRHGSIPSTGHVTPTTKPTAPRPLLGVDSGVWRESGPAVEGERWGEVIRSAGIYLEEVVRSATGLPTTLTPKALMGAAFGPAGPLQLGNSDHPNEAIGWRQMAEGFVAAVRNPGSHGAAGATVERAMGAVGTVSMLVTEIRKVRPDVFDDDGILLD